MKSLLYILILCIVVTLIPQNSKAQTNTLIEVGKSLIFHNETNNKQPADFKLKTYPNEGSYLKITEQYNNFEFSLYGEKQYYLAFYFSFKDAGASNNILFTRSYKLGVSALYNFNINSKRFRPFIGIALEQYSLLPQYSVGGINGDPRLKFPSQKNEYMAMATPADKGLAGSVFAGINYAFSKKFSLVAKARMNNWLAKNPLIDYDIRYHSPSYSYAFHMHDTGHIYAILLGVKLNITGDNF